MARLRLMGMMSTGMADRSDESGSEVRPKRRGIDGNRRRGQATSGDDLGKQPAEGMAHHQ
jgi:hypothetical protein